jgi:hypothetical protein
LTDDKEGPIKLGNEKEYKTEINNDIELKIDALA